MQQKIVRAFLKGIKKGNFELVDYFLNHLDDPLKLLVIKDKLGNTAFHCAAASGRLELFYRLFYLVWHKIEHPQKLVHLVNHTGKTPWHYAAQFGYSEFFQKPKEETSSSGGESQPAKPAIKRIKPKKVKVNLQTMISIIGQNFVNGSKAFIDNNEVITTFKSSVSLIADFILDTIGVHEVKVQNPDGEGSNTVKLMAK